MPFLIPRQSFDPRVVPGQPPQQGILDPNAMALSVPYQPRPDFNAQGIERNNQLYDASMQQEYQRRDLWDRVDAQKELAAQQAQERENMERFHAATTWNHTLLQSQLQAGHEEMAAYNQFYNNQLHAQQQFGIQSALHKQTTEAAAESAWKAHQYHLEQMGQQHSQHMEDLALTLGEKASAEDLTHQERREAAQAVLSQHREQQQAALDLAEQKAIDTGVNKGALQYTRQQRETMAELQQSMAYVTTSGMPEDRRQAELGRLTAQLKAIRRSPVETLDHEQSPQEFGDQRMYKHPDLGWVTWGKDGKIVPVLKPGTGAGGTLDLKQQQLEQQTREHAQKLALAETAEQRRKDEHAQKLTFAHEDRQREISHKDAEEFRKILTYEMGSDKGKDASEMDIMIPRHKSYTEALETAQQKYHEGQMQTSDPYRKRQFAYEASLKDKYGGKPMLSPMDQAAPDDLSEINHEKMRREGKTFRAPLNWSPATQQSPPPPRDNGNLFRMPHNPQQAPPAQIESGWQNPLMQTAGPAPAAPPVVAPPAPAGPIQARRMGVPATRSAPVVIPASMPMSMAQQYLNSLPPGTDVILPNGRRFRKPGGTP